MEPLLLWGIGLLLASLLVLALEIFVPSAGLLSVGAGALAIAGLVCLYRHDTLWGVTGTLLVVVLAPLIVNWGFRILPSTPIGRRMLFGEAGEARPVLPGAITTEYDALMGAVGEAVTDLRPVGVIKVEGQRLDALAETSYLRAGTRVRVTSVQGMQVKVRSAE